MTTRTRNPTSPDRQGGDNVDALLTLPPPLRSGLVGGSETTGHSVRLVTFTLVAVALFTAFFELGGHRTLTGHEAYVAVCAREMLASGDWIVPTFGGVPRLEKPPLAYWIVAGLSAVFGRTDAWVARLPSVLATLGLALLMAHWAGRRFGRTAAIAAGGVQMTIAWTLIYGRRAEVDVLLCLLTTGATFLIVHQPEDEPRPAASRRWLAIWSLLGLSFLAKFHYGPAMVLGPFVLFHLVTRTPRRVLRAVHPAGLAIFAACVVGWPLLVLWRMPAAADVWWHETVHRALPGTFSDDPWWYYGPHLVGLTLPWLPAALVAVPACWRRAWREGDAHDRYLGCWFVAQLAVLLASSNKHPQYLLAMLPIFTLLAAETVSRWIDRARETGEPLIRPRTAVRRGLLVLAAAWFGREWAVDRYPELATAITALVVVAVVGIVAVLALLAARRNPAAVVVGSLAVAVVFGRVNREVLPRTDRRRDLARFAAEVRREVGAEQVVHVHVEPYEFGANPVIHHLGSPVLRSGPATTLDTLAAADPTHVVTIRRHVPTVLARLPGRETSIASDDLVLLEIE